MNANLPYRLVCPHCQAGVVRVQRRFGDRWLSLFVPLARFRCETFQCGWEGLVRRGPRRAGGLGRGAG